jgi:hypothetical protein
MNFFWLGPHIDDFELDRAGARIHACGARLDGRVPSNFACRACQASFLVRGPPIIFDGPFLCGHLQNLMLTTTFVQFALPTSRLGVKVSTAN